MSDVFSALLDVALADLQMSTAKAIEKCSELVPARRKERFDALVKDDLDRVNKLIADKAQELAGRWSSYNETVRRHLEPSEKSDIEKLMQYFQTRDLRQEMSALDSSEIRKLISDGVQAGDDRFLKAARMGLKPLASMDFLTEQEAIHVDRRLRSTEQGKVLANGRIKLAQMQEAFEQASFRAKRKALDLIEKGAKQAVNQPAADPAQPRDYRTYKQAKDAQQALSVAEQAG